MYQKEITLQEALCGGGFYLKCLDGEKKYITFDTVINQGGILAVENEGMPKNGSMFVRGNLYIKFNVTFPKLLTREAKQALVAALPGPADRVAPPSRGTDVEILTTKYIDPESTRVDSPEDDDDGQPSNVQCRQA